MGQLEESSNMCPDVPSTYAVAARIPDRDQGLSAGFLRASDGVASDGFRDILLASSGSHCEVCRRAWKYKKKIPSGYLPISICYDN